MDNAKFKYEEERLSKPKKSKTKSKSKIKKSSKSQSSKKSQTVSAETVLVKYFTEAAKSSAIGRLINFYQDHLKQPYLALILKRFLRTFNNEKVKLNSTEIKKFVFKLRKCSGAMRLMRQERGESV